MKKAMFFITILCSLSAYAQVENEDTLSVKPLNEVVVKGEKPQIIGKEGIMVVDLPTIVRDKPVTNILEALGYLPGVTDNNGMIGLTGASDVTIILNGEPTNMPHQNLYQLLYITPIDRLKSVEVMYSAPAKYHVSGAVINIVLNNQAHYGSFGSAVAATYAVHDWTFDLNYGLSRTKSWNHEETLSNHLLNGQSTSIEDNMRRNTRNWSNTIFASASYKSLKLTYNSQIISNQKSCSHSSGTLGSFTNEYKMLSPVNNQNI